MIRSLADDEIEAVLRAEIVGRIGCSVDGRSYVVPVSYAFADGAIYAHSADGLKIRMMRQNPEVCFEVDHVEDLVNWHSAICHATYEELHGAEAREGLELLRDALRARLPRTLAHGQIAAEDSVATNAPIVFRLSISEMSGREERLYWELLPRALEATDGLTGRPADLWLSQTRAMELCDLASVLGIDDIWTAADRLAEGRSTDEVARSLIYQGVEPDMARRIVGFLTELRDTRAQPAGLAP